MADRTTLETRWEDAKGRVREAWGAVTDDDLQRLRGRWDQVVAMIHHKTEEALDTIEAKLDEILDELDEDEQTASTR